MRPSNITRCLLILIALFPSVLLAQTQDSGHRLWLNISGGTIEEDETLEAFDQLNDHGTGHLSLSYEYSFNRILSMGAGYLSGDSDQVTFFTDWFTDSELNYNSLFASVQLHFPLSDRNSLFLDISGYEYDFEVIDDSIIYASQDGSDIGYTYGWRIRFNDTFGMEVGREYLPMGDDLSIKGARVGVSYSF